MLSPKAKAEPRRGVNNKDILQVQVGFNWPLSQCTVRNQLPVIKQLAFTTIRDVIGYFCEIDLNLGW